MGHRRNVGPIGVAIGVVLLVCGVSAQTADEAFNASLKQFAAATFLEKEQLVQQMIDRRHSRTHDVLTALLEDRLFVRTSDMAVVVAKPADDGAESLDLLDPLTAKPEGSAPRDGLEKIGTNNRLRRFLRIALARYELADPNPRVRLAAVTEMLRSLDASTAAILKERQRVETDRRVRAEIELAIALSSLDGTGGRARVEAIAILAAHPDPQVRNRLAALLEKNVDGTFIESDPSVRDAAARTLASIDRALALYRGVETLFFGLSLGSVLVLVAIGLAITFGLMGVINMAHGELMMLGAYTTYVVQRLMPGHIGVSILIAIPAAFLVAGLAGIVVERCVIRFLYGRPLETLLATFGVSLLLQQLVRTLFTANNRDVETPAWLSGTWQVNDALALTYNRLFIILFTILVFGALVVFLKRTRLGLAIRAVSQNRAMAQALGVRSELVDALTFGVGSGIAGMAGVALTQLTNVGPNLGQSYIIDSFMVVVFGGVGNLWGTLIGGLSMGVVDKLLEPYAGAVLGKIAVLVALILFIQRRPKGLFPQMGRAVEDT